MLDLLKRFLLFFYQRLIDENTLLSHEESEYEYDTESEKVSNTLYLL